jgi:adenylosuccinate lyase
VGTRLSDAEQYAHLWGTPELAALFDEPARLQSWLDILVALARAQAGLGMIPAAAAEQIAAHARAEALDLAYVAEQTRVTSHSMLGLIRGLQRILPDSAGQYVYVGATVQDVTDTWFGLLMRDVGKIVRRDLGAIEESLLDLAQTHRDTLMAGRTHGQPGSPITFGFKVASWADEVRRHLDRLHEGRPRWEVGQLAGAVGVLGFFEPQGPRLRRAFCAELGLGDPGISWLTARDRVAEFAGVLSMIAGTLARIGNEVYELQRPEIGELREPTTPDTVGSITMPHKRNPEGSEHLDTLSRLIRVHAAVLVEGMVVGHERDGRGWKAEWVALPEVCLLTGVALRLARRLAAGLVVDVEAMRANLTRHGDRLASERLLAGLTGRLGKHAAQELMHASLAPGSGDVSAVVDAVVATGAATRQECEEWVGGAPAAAAAVMVDTVVSRARAARRAPPKTAAADGQAEQLPRFGLATLPTPLVRAHRLERALERGPIFIKRDDLTGFGVSGNKARPLELLLGDALAQGADVLVAAGATSSNFCAAAALAARIARLDCELIFPGPPPATTSVNVELARAAGARLCFDAVATREELDAAVVAHARSLRSQGRRPYAVPRGGATAVGAAGFAHAARELADECEAIGITPRTVVIATGSGGTQAGLVAGQVGFALPWRVVGASVSRPAEDVAGHVLDLSRQCADRLGLARPAAADVDVRDLIGPGFGIASTQDRHSARLALRHEGLLLDDYYGAKAMTLLRTLLETGCPTPVVFWHTGGVGAALTTLTEGAGT